MTLDRHSTLRGVTTGLWTLAGLTLLTDALLPGVGRFHVLAPWLLAASIGWTVIIPNRENPPLLHTSRLLRFAGFALALAASFVLIHAGDHRSFLLVGFTGFAVLLLAAVRRH